MLTDTCLQVTNPIIIQADKYFTTKAEKSHQLFDIFLTKCDFHYEKRKIAVP